MKLEEKQLKTEYIYKGKIINVRRDDAELPDGNTSIREVVEHPGGVAVAALTDRDEILFVSQFRYPYGEIVLEIPAGKRNGKGENPLSCGIRELKEETGASAEKFIFLGEMYPTPGYCDEVLYLYAATGLTFGEQQPDADEFLEVQRIPLEDAFRMVMAGEIKDAKTICTILKVKFLKENNEI